MKKYKKIHKNKNKKGNLIYQIALPKSFVESMFDDDDELRVVVEYKDTRRKGKRIIISKDDDDDDDYDFE